MIPKNFFSPIVISILFIWSITLLPYSAYNQYGFFIVVLTFITMFISFVLRKAQNKWIIFSLPTVLFLYFGILCCILNVFTVDTIRYDSICLWLTWMLILVLFTMNHSQLEKQKIVVIIAIVSVCMQFFYSILQCIGIFTKEHGYFVFEGTMTNPGMAALSVMCCLPWIWEEWLKAKSRIIKNLFLMLCLAGFLFILFSRSRAALISITFCFLVWLYIGQYHVKLKRIFFSGKRKIFSQTLLILSGVLIIYYLFDIKKESSIGRIFIYSASLSIIYQHFWTGIGEHMFQKEFADYTAAFFSFHPNDTLFTDIVYIVNTPFNDYFRIAIEHGVPLLLLFLFSIGFLLRKSWIEREQILHNPAPLLCLITILVASLFTYPLELPLIFLMFLYSFACISQPHGSMGYHIKLPNCLFHKTLLSISLFAAIIAVTFFVKKEQWNYHFRILSTSIEFDENKAIELISKIKYRYFIPSSDAERLGNYLYETNNSVLADSIFLELSKYKPSPTLYIQWGNNLAKQNYFAEAENKYKYALLLQPYLLRPHYYLAKLYLQQDRDDGALKEINYLLNKKIKVDNEWADQIIVDTKQLKRELFFKSVN